MDVASPVALLTRDGAATNHSGRSPMCPPRNRSINQKRFSARNARQMCSSIVNLIYAAAFQSAPKASPIPFVRGNRWLALLRANDSQARYQPTERLWLMLTRMEDIATKCSSPKFSTSTIVCVQVNSRWCWGEVDRPAATARLGATSGGNHVAFLLSLHDG